MKKDTPAKLIEAATILFARKGYSAVSIRELAQAAAANSALISYHFGGKEGLYRAVLDQHFSHVARGLSAIEAKQLPPLECICHFAEMLIALHRENPFLLRLVYSELVTPTPCFQSVIKVYIGRNYQFLCDAIRAGIASGEIRPDVDPGYSAFALAGVINFYFFAKPLEGQLQELHPDSDAEYGRQAIDIYLNGIRRKKDE